MLQSKILQPDALDRFIAFNRQNKGAYVAKAYLEGALVRVFFNDDTPEEWVAAYVVNAKAPFRCLNLLTEQQQTTQLALLKIKEDDLAEITLLSRVTHVKWSTREREQYYNLGLFDALRTGRQVILGATVEEKLVDIQMEVFPHLFYEGTFNFFGQSEFGWIFYARWHEVVRNGLMRFMRIMSDSQSRPQPARRTPKPTRSVW